MELKKSPKTDLEKKKILFLQAGLIISLALVLTAFEWKSYKKQGNTLLPREISDVPEEMIPVTNTKPPPPPEPPKTTTELNIVKNEIDVEDKIIIDAGAGQDTKIEQWRPQIPDEKYVEDDKIFIVVEEDPGFPGGEQARMQYLANNIEYPQLARENRIQGTVYVTFVVEKDGSVTDVRVLRGIGGGCDQEAIEVVKNMPKWKPGKQRGKPVRVQFNMPIRFTLQ
ncbi:MAG TPA: energy transducer TonB [Bacteroidales bacterium]|nr:energy transducer TonB [Bacteroidales bacterium]